MKKQLAFGFAFTCLLVLAAMTDRQPAVLAETVPPPAPPCEEDCLFLPALHQEPLWTGVITTGINDTEHTYDVHLIVLNNTERCMKSITATVEYFWDGGSTSRTGGPPTAVPPDVFTAIRVWVKLSDLGGELTSYRIVNVSYEECD